MKKIKLLSPMLAIATTATAVLPTVGCSNVEHVKYEGNKTVNAGEKIVLTLDSDKYDLSKFTIKAVGSNVNELIIKYEKYGACINVYVTSRTETEGVLPFGLSISYGEEWTQIINDFILKLNHGADHFEPLKLEDFEEKFIQDNIPVSYEMKLLNELEANQTLDIAATNVHFYKDGQEISGDEYLLDIQFNQEPVTDPKDVSWIAQIRQKATSNDEYKITAKFDLVVNCTSSDTKAKVWTDTISSFTVSKYFNDVEETNIVNWNSDVDWKDPNGQIINTCSVYDYATSANKIVFGTKNALPKDKQLIADANCAVASDDNDVNSIQAFLYDEGDDDYSLYVVSDNKIAFNDKYGRVEDDGDSYGTFYDCNNCASIVLDNTDFSEMSDMSYMFLYCYSLTKLDLSNFDTSNVTTMKGMFECCRALTSIDVSNFNTSNVTSMASMFYDCEVLESLDLTKFDTSKVTTMKYMFYACYLLKSLDLSSFDTSNVTTMADMFCGCICLVSLDLSNFDTSNVTTMAEMFCDCALLESLDLSSFNTSNVTNMDIMFYACLSIGKLDLTSFTAKNLMSVRYMFNGGGYEMHLSYIYATKNFNLSGKGLEDEKMFEGCKNLVGGLYTPYDIEHINSDYAKIDGGDTDPGYFTLKTE